MSASTFAQELAEKCVSTHVINGARFVHVKDRSGVAVLSASPGCVHCPEIAAREHVYRALVGLIEAGIEEGGRQAADSGVEDIGREVWAVPSPEALAAARAEGHEAGIAVGWARALAVAIRMVEALQEREEMAKRELRRTTDELRVAEAIRSAISEAMPGEDR